jgi:hypothetical protein
MRCQLTQKLPFRPSPNSGVNVLFRIAGFRPGRRGPFVSAKVPKTSDAPPGLIKLIRREVGDRLTRGAHTSPSRTRASDHGTGGRRRSGGRVVWSRGNFLWSLSLGWCSLGLLPCHRGRPLLMYMQVPYIWRNHHERQQPVAKSQACKCARSTSSIVEVD